MDIATITDPKPFSKTYAFILIEDQIERSEVDIDFSAKSYGAFIEKNVQDTEVVSDEEHIAFLMYWVSSHLLCTHSLQIPMCSYNLAQDLHFREDICLKNHITPERDIPDNLDLKIEEARLTYPTPSKEFCSNECYTKYIKDEDIVYLSLSQGLSHIGKNETISMYARNVGVEDELEEKEDTQSHSESSPSKQMSLL
ncbi:hypothetical protein JHK84_028214 [Glycine max]|nr:hypothetical protein JHK84_028214 [Glycine max]